MRPLFAAALAAVGCAPTYAPPVRSPHAGAPARAREGDVVLGGAALGHLSGAPRIGGPTVGIGLRDWVALEGGADIFRDEWVMGWAGARFTHAPNRYARHHYAGDLETGLGLGFGGQLCGNDRDGACEETDDRSAYDRFAGGALLGLGVSGHFAFFSVFARTRLQLTRAQGIPPTLWAALGPGLQFRVAETVDLYTQVTYGGYVNSIDATSGLFWEFGVAIRIPTPL